MPATSSGQMLSPGEGWELCRLWGRQAQLRAAPQPEPRAFSNHCPEPPDTAGREFLMLSLSLAHVRPQPEAALQPPTPCCAQQGWTGELLCSSCCNWTWNDRKSMTGLGNSVSDSTATQRVVWVFKSGFQIKLELEFLSTFSALSLVEICDRISDMKGEGNEESLLSEPLCALPKLSLTPPKQQRTEVQHRPPQVGGKLYSTADPCIPRAPSFQAFSCLIPVCQAGELSVLLCLLSFYSPSPVLFRFFPCPSSFKQISTFSLLLAFCLWLLFLLSAL